MTAIILGAFLLFVWENITVMMKIIASIMIRMRGNMMAIIIINNYENEKLWYQWKWGSTFCLHEKTSHTLPPTWGWSPLMCGDKHDNNKGNCITSHLRMIHFSLTLDNSFNLSISTSAKILTICHQKTVHECNRVDFDNT